MATAIKIPDLSTNIDHVTLVKWLKKEGDSVERGDPLCEVETDKAVSELESIAKGVLLKRMIAEGTEIQQGTIVAYVGVAGEAIPQASATAGAAQPAAAATSAVAGGSGAGAKVSPLLRNLAKSLGVDLNAVTGTGPDGKITREDIERTKAGGPTASAAPVKPSPAPVAAGGKPLSTNQSVVAKRVSQSHREIPPINVSSALEMAALLQWRKKLLQETGQKVSFDAIFILVVSRVIKEFPHFRSRLENDRVVTSEAGHVGIAIGVGDELYTPVVKDATAKSIAEIETVVQQLSDKAKQGRFSQDDFTGATLTVSNLGMFPVRSFDAIIPPGQVAVLAIGATEETPVVREGQVKILSMAQVTLSVDHRLINGREAGQFLARLKEEMAKL